MTSDPGKWAGRREGDGWVQSSEPAGPGGARPEWAREPSGYDLPYDETPYRFDVEASDFLDLAGKLGSS